jgi:cell division protein FtsB
MVMARSIEEIIQLQLGAQALQLARLAAENEALQEKVKELSDNRTDEKKPKE